MPKEFNESRFVPIRILCTRAREHEEIFVDCKCVWVQSTYNNDATEKK